MTRLLTALLILVALPALAEPRLALVIGNGGYDSAPLANPPADARLTGAALRDAGFDVTELIDGDREAMKRAARAFAQKVKAAGPNAAAVFYYAGHGVQVEGRNYLIPVGAPVESAADLDYEAVEAQWVLDLMGEAAPAVSVFILDACRNNPFRALSRATSRGLARMDAPRGSILSYATAPGATALDGSGANSPFTSALAGAIRTPGLKVEEMFKRVRVAVLDATGGRQTPWESSSLIGDFYFTPGAGGGAQPVLARPSVKPGQTFRDCPDCPEMTALAGGAAALGAGGPEGGPVPVTLRPYALSTTEVTRGAFSRFVAETGHRPAAGCWYLALVWVYDAALNWRNTGYAQTDDHPVVCIRWSDAVAYADWLSAKTGHRYRLPTEAEWEAAAAPAPWGGNAANACAYANVHDAAANAKWGSGAVHALMPCDDGAAGTAPAAAYRANAKGLKNMIGNVAEWTQDCWSDSHRGRPATGAARQDGDCGRRVSKGGAFISPAPEFTPAFRFASVAKDPNVYLGFRLARDLN